MRIFGAGIYDFAAFGAIFVVFVIIFLGALISPKKIKIPLFIISALVFVSAPVLCAFVVHNHINKVDLNLADSKKLEFVDSYFIQGSLKNLGWHALTNCDLYIYSTRFFPLFKPDFVIEFEKMNLARGEEIAFDRVIKDLNQISKIAPICY